MRVDYDAATISIGGPRGRRRAGSAPSWRASTGTRCGASAGLDCPDCARTLARSVEMLPGVVSAELNFASAMLLVEHDADADPSALRRADRSRARATAPRRSAAPRWTRAGASRAEAGRRAPRRDSPVRWPGRARTAREVAVVGSGVFIVVGWVARRVGVERSVGSGAGVASFVCFLVAVGFGETSARAPRARLDPGAQPRHERAHDDRRRRCDGDRPGRGGGDRRLPVRVRRMARGARAGAYPQLDSRPDGARARDRAASSGDGGVVEVAAGRRASSASCAIVRPGERIPLDGEVVAGVSAVDESAVTGEPLPAAKQPGDAVYAGSLNGNGLLEVRVTALAEDSTLARIVFLVEEAQASRAPVAAAGGPLQPRLHAGGGGHRSARRGRAAAAGAGAGRCGAGHLRDWSVWLYRGLVVLVAACPCALVISTPVTFVSAIARAGREGVLVKGGAYLETGRASRRGRLRQDRHADGGPTGRRRRRAAAGRRCTQRYSRSPRRSRRTRTTRSREPCSPAPQLDDVALRPVARARGDAGSRCRRHDRWPPLRTRQSRLRRGDRATGRRGARGAIADAESGGSHRARARRGGCGDRVPRRRAIRFVARRARRSRRCRAGGVAHTRHADRRQRAHRRRRSPRQSASRRTWRGCCRRTRSMRCCA